MSAFAVLTLREERVMQLFVNKESLDAGAVACVFHHNGKVTTVVVDTLFPCDAGRFAFASSKDVNELWIAIVEKAYARLCGSYEAIEAGFVDQVSAALRMTHRAVREMSCDLDE